MGFIKYKNEDGTWQEVLVIKGEPGPPGPKPEAGTDYWTEEDKEEIRKYIDEQIGETENVLDDIIAMQEERIGGDSA